MFTPGVTYEENKIITYKQINSKTEILEEIKKVLLSPINKDNNCVSLYDVLTLLKKLYNEYDSIESMYKDKLNYMVKSKISDNSLIYFRDIDFTNKIIKLAFKICINCDWDNIYICKQNEDLCVVKSESPYTDEIFSALCSTLSEMYDKLLKYADYKDYRYAKNNIKPVNSNFNVEINNHGIELSFRNFVNCKKEMELFAPSYDSDYKLKYNSSIIHEAFSGKENEIFKRIFVKISDCPKWSQNILYEIRKNELIKEQKKQDKIKRKEIRKQKRLELQKKIFTFTKE